MTHKGVHAQIGKWNQMIFLSRTQDGQADGQTDGMRDEMSKLRTQNRLHPCLEIVAPPPKPQAKQATEVTPLSHRLWAELLGLSLKNNGGRPAFSIFWFVFRDKVSPCSPCCRPGWAPLFHEFPFSRRCLSREGCTDSSEKDRGSKHRPCRSIWSLSR